MSISIGKRILLGFGARGQIGSVRESIDAIVARGIVNQRRDAVCRSE